MIGYELHFSASEIPLSILGYQHSVMSSSLEMTVLEKQFLLAYTLAADGLIKMMAV